MLHVIRKIIIGVHEIDESAETIAHDAKRFAPDIIAVDKQLAQHFSGAVHGCVNTVGVGGFKLMNLIKPSLYGGTLRRVLH